MSYAGKRACVIGAGFGGLALAIRLQSAGVATTLVEGRDRPGGRAYFWERETEAGTFTFDAGPTVVTDPDCLKELWAISGHDLAEDVDLVPVAPFYRLDWPDGTKFDYSNDGPALHRQIAALNPADVAGYERFLEYSAAVHQEGYVKLGTVPFLDFKSMLKAAPALAKHQAWRSVYAMVSHFVQNEHLREALSFHTLLVGGNPMTTSAIYALIHKLEQDGGVWWTKGGTNRLVAGMVHHFERLGGTVRLGDPVERIDTDGAGGTRVTGVATRSGWSGRFDAVASNADIMHSYRDLLGRNQRGFSMGRRLKRKRFSPGLFVVHFGLRGSFPHIAHHTIPVRAALQGAARRYLCERRAARGFLGVSAPPEYQRCEHGAAGPCDLLCAGPGGAHGQAGGGLGGRGAAAGAAHPGRGGAAAGARSAGSAGDPVLLCPRRFRAGFERAPGQRLQP